MLAYRQATAPEKDQRCAWRDRALWPSENRELHEWSQKFTADYLPLFAAQPLAFTPGEAFAYSNGGYVVLGEIVARAAGSDYYDVVRDRIYRPAGMQDTDSYFLDADVSGRAVGYTATGAAAGTLVDATPLHGVRGSAAGGGYSTVVDLHRFATALLYGRLLPGARGGLAAERPRGA